MITIPHDETLYVREACSGDTLVLPAQTVIDSLGMPEEGRGCRSAILRREYPERTEDERKKEAKLAAIQRTKDSHAHSTQRDRKSFE